MTSADLYRSAYTLIAQHGAEASICAALKSHEPFEAGDPIGQAWWMRLVGLIEELLSDQPAPGESVH